MSHDQPRDLLTLFREQALLRPDGAAVRSSSGDATYRQLLCRAGNAAAGLRARGAGPGSRVAVVLPPGRDAVAVVLGALWCGAAYAPIDPEQPAGRIRRMLDGSAPCVTVTEAAGTGTAPQDIIGSWDGPQDIAPVPTPQDVAATDVAYVVHTSGSTGRPKGIQVEHHSVVNLLAAMDGAAPVPARPAGTWWTSPGFDVAVWEMWSVLAYGGTLAITPPEDRLDPARFCSFLERVDPHSCYVPPAHLPALAEHLTARPDACRRMRRLLVGVEPVPLALLHELMRVRGRLQVVNAYGPAETTVCCTAYRVPRHAEDPAGTGRAPIGTALPGNRTHVIDDAGEPSSTGRGELVITGRGVARGYLGSAPHDDARFFFLDTPSGPERAYRTGDMVHTLPSGDLVFDGRRDQQFKVRGHRIEAGEVEVCLRKVPQVLDVAVGVRDTAGPAPVLVCYVAAESRPADLEIRLRKAAAGLPDYAVPGAYVVLDRLPLTLNGKTDHQALADLPLPAAPAAPAAPPAHGYAPAGYPQGRTAEQVARVWNEVLAPTEVVPGLRFAALGGTSMAAVRAARLLSRRTGREVLPHHVMRADSVAGLADCVDRLPAFDATALTGSGRTAAPLAPGQLAIWMHEQLADPGQRLYVEPLAFVCRGPLDRARLRSAFDRALRAHPAFTAGVRDEDGDPWLELDQHSVALSEQEWPADADAENPVAFLTTCVPALAVGTEPLMRAFLWRVADDHHIIMLAWHHMVVDNWSAQRFLEDWAACFADEHLDTAPGPVTICDVNHHLVGQARSGRVRAGVRAAAEELAALAGPGGAGAGGRRVARARDGGPGSARTAGERVRPVEVRQDLVSAAEATARAGGHTVQNVLSAAYQKALADTFGTPDFLLGVASSGRDRPEWADVSGNLVNTLLVPCRDVAGTPLDELIAITAAEVGRARDAALPFPDLAGRLRSRAAGSVPAVYFNLYDEPRLDLTGLRCSPVPLVMRRVRFDLNLGLGRTGGRVSGYLESRTAFADDVRVDRLLASWAAHLRSLPPGPPPALDDCGHDQNSPAGDCSTVNTH